MDEDKDTMPPHPPPTSPGGLAKPMSNKLGGASEAFQQAARNAERFAAPAAAGAPEVTNTALLGEVRDLLAEIRDLLVGIAGHEDAASTPPAMGGDG